MGVWILVPSHPPAPKSKAANQQPDRVDELEQAK